jgi:hypothetical protein
MTNGSDLNELAWSGPATDDEREDLRRQQPAYFPERTAAFAKELGIVAPRYREGEIDGRRGTGIPSPNLQLTPEWREFLAGLAAGDRGRAGRSSESFFRILRKKA